MYFTSRIMFSLNSFAIKNREHLVGNKYECFGGYKLPYTYLLQYERAKGKIIFFPNFLSTSEERKLAENYAQRYESLKLYETNLKFSVLYIITNIYSKNWVSNGIKISSVSNYKNEKEIIFQPFSFFYVRDVTIDIKNYMANIYLITIGKTEILEERIKEGKEIEYNKELNIMQIK